MTTPGSLVLALLPWLSTAVLAAQQPDTYPLACRGPGTIVAHPTMASLQNRVSQRVLLFDFLAAKSSQAAGRQGDGLEPGACGWMDRPLNEHEPRTLRVKLDPDYYDGSGSGYQPLPLIYPILDCMGSSNCVTVLPVRSGWTEPSGDSLQVTQGPNTEAILWSTPLDWTHVPIQYVYFIHLDGSSRPDLARLPAAVPVVRVIAP